MRRLAGRDSSLSAHYHWNASTTFGASTSECTIYHRTYTNERVVRERGRVAWVPPRSDTPLWRPRLRLQGHSPTKVHLPTRCLLRRRGVWHAVAIPHIKVVRCDCAIVCEFLMCVGGRRIPWMRSALDLCLQGDNRSVQGQREGIACICDTWSLTLACADIGTRAKKGVQMGTRLSFRHSAAGRYMQLLQRL